MVEKILASDEKAITTLTTHCHSAVYTLYGSAVLVSMIAQSQTKTNKKLNDVCQRTYYALNKNILDAF